LSTDWPLPKRVRDHLALDTPRATVAYWAGVGLVTGSVFVPRVLPCVDYPQHLALSEVAHRLAGPSAPEHGSYVLNYFTYNALFHWLVARLASVVPIELAGRLVVALSLALIGASVLAIVRVLRRPPTHAALFTPIIFSFSVGWGFVNYALGTAIAVLTLVFLARALVRPSAWNVGAVAALGLLCAFAHVLAMLLLCVLAASLAPEVAWRATSRAGQRPHVHALRAVLHAAVALLPLLVGCWFCVKVYQEQYDWDPKMYTDPTVEGTSPPIWQKVFMFGAFATDLHSDRTDQVILYASVIVVVACAAARLLAWYKHRRRGAPYTPEATPPLVLPFVVATAAYLLTPMVLIGTHLIFPRLAQAVLFGAVLACPAFPEGPAAVRVRRYALAVGLLAGVNLIVHTAVFAAETNDVARVVDDLPPRRAATAVVYDPHTFAFRNGTLVHLAAYYAARKEGRWAFSFARYLSVPVRFKPGGQPAWPKRGWEFSAWDYNPRCKYARAFDLVIVRAPDFIRADADAETEVRKRVFGWDASAPRLLSHHGRYWAFDTAGLPDDGTF
jgi:hypothetical protein